MCSRVSKQTGATAPPAAAPRAAPWRAVQQGVVKGAEVGVRGRNRTSRRCAMSCAMTDSRQPRARRSAARCPSDSAIASCGPISTTYMRSTSPGPALNSWSTVELGRGIKHHQTSVEHVQQQRGVNTQERGAQGGSDQPYHDAAPVLRGGPPVLLRLRVEHRHLQRPQPPRALRAVADDELRRPGRKGSSVELGSV